MNLSTRGRYGTRAMVELAVNGTAKPLHVRAIAKRQDIPIEYLSQILHSLRKAKLVKSVRGVNGGYILAKPSSKIALEDILGVLEKTLTPVLCVDDPSCCNRTDFCPTRTIWSKLNDAILGVLQNTTLEELATEQKAQTS